MMRQKSIEILRANDKGGYTVPTSSGLYPAQWNWDSCLVAMGFAQFDEGRAWQEIETLFSGQWPDGMVPHIIFHGDDSSYFPNSSVWRGGPSKRSSGITQPPVAATVVRYLAERFGFEHTLAHLQTLVPKLLDWHRWFYRARDPEGSGFVAVIHPWESGMDNSPIWDASLAVVPPGPSVAKLRKDTTFADVAVRPTSAEYDRYINLVMMYRNENYDEGRLYDIAPFRVCDVGFNSILLRANRDLRFLLESMGDEQGVLEVDSMIARSCDALERAWDENDAHFYSFDSISRRYIPKPGIAGLLPLYADPEVSRRHPEIIARIKKWLGDVKYGVPSFEPGRPEFESKRYWRGPVWLVVNWMLMTGLRENGYEELARRVRKDSLDVVEKSGFHEYFDPLTGEGLGGTDFSWTAAMVLLLSASE
jgi:hypothetical protein